MKVIIVGGVAGGASCAARLRRLDEDAEILMIERGPYVSYANCGLPYHVGDVIPEEKQLLVASPDLFQERFAIEVRTENEVLTVEMFEVLRERGDIYTKTIEQAYDEKEGMFLPDRFVRGTCPFCKTPDQYGDACEVCGATYNPTDLIDPRSKMSGSKPVLRSSCSATAGQSSRLCSSSRN